MGKKNHKITVITIFSSIIIILLVGLTSIITSMYVINKEASANLLLLVQNKEFILEDSFKQIETATDDLANYAEISFSPKEFKKYRINYLKNYTQSMVPIVKNFMLHTDKAMGCYFNFDPTIVKSNETYEAWVYNKNENGKDVEIAMTAPVSSYYPVDKPELQWYYKPKNTGKPLWTNVYSDIDLSVPMISYIRPIYVEKKFIGTAGMDMSIKKLGNIINDLKVYDTGYAFLLDKDLNFIVHKEYKLNDKLEKINKELFKSLKSSCIKNTTGIINYKHQGVDKVACYKKLNNEWIFVIAVPKAEILRQKFNLEVLMVGITLLSTILAILIMINKE